jgi:hypothetical protein
MDSKQHCLGLLRAVRQAGQSPEDAYLVRTRLRRALVGMRRGAYPSQRSSGPASEDPAIARLVRTLDQRVAHLCQPSEALDLRWKQEWAGVATDLEKLERLLTKL